jgi:poly-beta-1,6-N-acetyl-D-glucosamine synthase
MNYVDTDLIMTLDADGSVDPDTLTRLASAFREDKYLAALSPNVRILNDSSLLGYIQMLDFLVGFRSKKARSIGRHEFVVGGHGATYRTHILKRIGGYGSDALTEDIDASLRLASQGNKFYKIRYDADVLVYTEGVPTLQGLYKQRYRWKLGALQAIYKYRHVVFNPSQKYTRSLTLYQLPTALWSEVMLILEPFIMLSFLTFCLAAGNAGLFFGCYLSMSAVAVFTVISDEHLNRSDRIRLLLFSLVAYPFFYMMTSINVVAIMQTIKNLGRVLLAC